MKKITAVLLTLIMVLSCCSISVFAKQRAEETKEENIAEWFNALEDARDYFNGGNEQGIVYTYKKTGGKNHTNCAEYVSKAMQLMGWLPEGYNIWLSSTINGRGASYIKSSNDFEIYYPDKSTKDCIADGTLQPGDIAGFHTGPGATGGVHTMVYIGDKMWYSYGISTKNWNTGPLRKGSYDNKKIKVIIRYKNLKVSNEHSLKISVTGGTASTGYYEGSSLDLLVEHNTSVQINFKPDEGYDLEYAKMDGKPVDIENGIYIEEMCSNHKIDVKYEYEYARYLPDDKKNAKPKNGLIKGLDDYTNDTAFEVEANNVFAEIWQQTRSEPKVHELKVQDGEVDFSSQVKKDGEYTVIVTGEIEGQLYADSKTFVYDNTGPQIDIKGTDGSQYFEDAVSVSISAEDKNIKDTVITVNGKETALTEIVFETDGKYSVQVVSEDKAGNTSIAQNNFVIRRPINSYDLSPEITTEQDSNKNITSVTIKPSIPGEIIMRVHKDGEVISEEAASGSITYNDFKNPGEYELYTYVNDIFGNTKVIRPVTVTIKE